MKHLNNRQLAALETKKKLINAAKEIICEKGLVNTSISEITNACGVANGTFYTYFKKKEDIIFALRRDMYQEIYEKAQAYDGTLMERLIFFIKNFSGYIEKSSLKLCQEWIRNTVDPDLVENEDDRTKLDFDINSVKEILNKGIEQGELKKDTPVEMLAHTLMDLLYGQMLCWDMTGGAYSLEERATEFCDHFLDTMMAPYLI